MSAAIRAVSFDLDETLWRLDGVLERAEERSHAFFRRHYPALAERYPVEALHALRDAVLAERPELRHNVTALRLETLRRAAAAVGAPERAVNEGFQVFYEARQEVTLYGDAVPLLERLHGHLPLVALTNGNADVHRIGLGHYFRLALSAVEVGVAKPQRPIFETAARRIGAPLEAMVHVGDDPRTDVYGAAHNGMRAIWLNRSGQHWPAELPEVPYVEIPGLDELDAALREQAARQTGGSRQ